MNPLKQFFDEWIEITLCLIISPYYYAKALSRRKKRRKNQ